jgi:hypothetical protein
LVSPLKVDACSSSAAGGAAATLLIPQSPHRLPEPAAKNALRAEVRRLLEPAVALPPGAPVLRCPFFVGDRHQLACAVDQHCSDVAKWAAEEKVFGPSRGEWQIKELLWRHRSAPNFRQPPGEPAPGPAAATERLDGYAHRSWQSLSVWKRPQLKERRVPAKIAATTKEVREGKQTTLLGFFAKKKPLPPAAAAAQPPLKRPRLDADASAGGVIELSDDSD